MAPSPQVREIATAQGPARVHVERPPSGAEVRGSLLLGHGAGGGITAPDLRVARTAALASGWVVGLVEQPWRVAGRKVATPPPRLDEAWTEIVAALAAGRGRLPAPYAFGGRSAGARVACRLAGPLGADRVLALAFPLHPPGRPERSRIDELAGAVRALPVLVVQGQRDPFGSGADVRTAVDGVVSRALARRCQVVEVPGDHGLKAIAGPASPALRAFLSG